MSDTPFTDARTAAERDMDEAMTMLGVIAEAYVAGDAIPLRAVAHEVLHLRSWKAQALQVLGDWEKCTELLAANGHAGVLGTSNPEFVLRYIRRALMSERSERPPR